MIADLPSGSGIKDELLERIETIANLALTPEEKEALFTKIEGIVRAPGDTLMMLQNIDDEIADIQPLMTSEDSGAPSTETTKALEKIREFKKAVAALPSDSGIRKMFFTLMNNPEIVLTGNEKEQLKKVQEYAEKWFDDAMDRVSG